MNDTIDVKLLISVLSILFSILTFFIGRTSASKNAGEREGIILTELDYIKKSISDLLEKVENRDVMYNDMCIRLKSLEEKMKALEDKFNIYQKFKGDRE